MVVIARYNGSLSSLYEHGMRLSLGAFLEFYVALTYALHSVVHESFTTAVSVSDLTKRAVPRKYRVT